MILVIDDHYDTCELVKRLLTAAGLPTECITDPVEALAFLAKVKPQAVLLDVMMPEMSGIELLRRVRANPTIADVPVLMMTATNNLDDLAEAERLGAREILQKGAIDWKSLPDRVRSYVN